MISFSSELKSKLRQLALPLLIFVMILGVTIFVFQSSAMKPEIVSIEPTVVTPGSEMTIYGTGFGSQKGPSEVFFGSLPASLNGYLEWSDQKVVVSVPVGISSGTVRVKTDQGVSNGQLFANKETIPTLNYDAPDPILPYIDGISSETAYVGDIITLQGRNFGTGSAAVDVVQFNSMRPGNTTVGIKGSGPVFVLQGSRLDFDYLQWSDNEIRLQVPDGASSGAIKVVTERGVSNGLYLEIIDGPGTKSLVESKGYQLQYGLELKIVNADPGNLLELWFPRPFLGIEQNRLELAVEGNTPLWNNYLGMMRFRLQDLESWRNYNIVVNTWFDRHTVETDINPSRVVSSYPQDSQLYDFYTDPDKLIPSDSAYFVSLTPRVVGRERNPYLKADRIYKYLLDRLTYDAGGDGLTLKDSVLEKRAGAMNYASLFVTMCRAADVPARLNSGILVYRGQGSSTISKSSIHFWAEFYLPRFGWVPVDPLLGDNVRFGNLPSVDSPADYYFGNLDNQHIVFSKGVVQLPHLDSENVVVTSKKGYSLQTIYEEYNEFMNSYTTNWTEVDIIDWW